MTLVGINIVGWNKRIGIEKKFLCPNIFFAKNSQEYLS